MSSLDNVWAATTADSASTDDNPAPAGYMGIVRIADYRTGKSKRGEDYFLIELKDDQNGYSWPIYKQFTKNGQAHAGSVKSAKITLRQLGLEVQSPAHLEPMLKGIVGRYFAVEQVASDRINQTTGHPYVNTNITGVASPPAQAVPAQPVAAPVQFAQPPEVQAPQFQQPPALPGAPVPQNTAAGAQFGNDIPWENAPGVQPSHVQQG